MTLPAPGGTSGSAGLDAVLRSAVRANLDGGRIRSGDHAHQVSTGDAGSMVGLAASARAPSYSLHPAAPWV
jgi:hypothetical protein